MKKILISFLVAALCIKVLFFFSYPKLLRNVKKADKIGIVKEIKEIKIKNVLNPINACIEEYKDNTYLLSFRINEKTSSYIGLTQLDKNFNEIKDYTKIDTLTKTAEDARIFKYNNDYFLMYNDQLAIEHIYRTMHLAKLNEALNKIEYKTSLDLHIKPVEKNWTPFIYQNKLFLTYNLMPHKIMYLPNPKKNDLKHLVFSAKDSYTRFYWDWGSPRGGSSPKLVDGEYLSFFHSFIGKNKNKKYYVIGAYTFLAHPPYKITKVSSFPIVFGNNKKTRIVFPTGFVIKNENGKDFIYLSYGENDTKSKIAVIDKDKLFEYMKKVD